MATEFTPTPDDVWQIAPFNYSTHSHTVGNYTLTNASNGGTYTAVLSAYPTAPAKSGIDDPIAWLRSQVEEIIDGVDWPKAA